MASWLSLAGTFALFAVASFLPEKRLWGVNHLAFYPAHVRTPVLVLAGLCLLPPVGSLVWRVMLRVFRPFSRALADGANAIALSTAISFIVFAALRSATRLLGDGTYITSSYRTAVQNGMNPADYFRQVTLTERIYPAADFAGYAVSWTAGRFGASPTGGLWILSCLIGAAFVFWLLLSLRREPEAARDPRETDASRLVTIGFVLLTGAVVLFFGYVEHYTPVVALGALYLLMAHRVISGTARLWVPGVVLALSLLFHALAVLLVPSYVWLVLWTGALRRDPRRALRTAAVVAVATLAVFFTAGWTPVFSGHFLPPLGQKDADSVLSVPHATDVMNEAFLLSPAWLFVAVLAIRRRLSRHRAGAGSDHTPVAELLDTGKPVSAFGWTAFLPCVLFLLLFKPELGMARDWDLYSFTALGLAAAGLPVVRRYANGGGAQENRGFLLSSALVLSAAMVCPWIGVNASSDRSVTRYVAILSYDQTHAGYALENLALHYESTSQFSKQMETLRKAYDLSRNPRLLFKLGRVQYDTVDLKGAAATLRAVVAAKPDYDDARKLLVDILASQKAVEEIAAVCREGIAHSPGVPDYHFFLGNAYLAMGKTDEGLKSFETCSKLNPPPAMVREMQRLASEALASKPSKPAKLGIGAYQNGH